MSVNCDFQNITNLQFESYFRSYNSQNKCSVLNDVFVWLQGVRSSVLHLNNLEEGDYVFTLKVTDTSGQTATADVHVYVKPGQLLHNSFWNLKYNKFSYNKILKLNCRRATQISGALVSRGPNKPKYKPRNIGINQIKVHRPNTLPNALNFNDWRLSLEGPGPYGHNSTAYSTTSNAPRCHFSIPDYIGDRVESSENSRHENISCRRWRVGLGSEWQFRVEIAISHANKMCQIDAENMW